MFEKLRTKWKVSGLQLFLVLLTFALGGSLCGYVSKRLIALLPVDRGLVWIVIYIVILTITWPFCVMLVSIITGQFSFFKNYLSRLGSKMTGSNKPRIAIFASGAGSNAKKIIHDFRNKDIHIALIVTNNPAAGVIEIAKENNIPFLVISKEEFKNTGYTHTLRKRKIKWIVLAGFLWKVPPVLIEAYRNRIVNIHPALLPSYGGKGMYGHHVHAAVLNNKEEESGITIHLVDEIYDHGKILFQANCKVEQTDTPESLANKIHALEHKHYSSVIENMVKGKLRSGHL